MLLLTVSVAKHWVHLALTFQETSLIWYIHSVCVGKKFFVSWHLLFLLPGACLILPSHSFTILFIFLSFLSSFHQSFVLWSYSSTACSIMQFIMRGHKQYKTFVCLFMLTHWSKFPFKSTEYKMFKYFCLFSSCTVFLCFLSCLHSTTIWYLLFI